MVEGPGATRNGRKVQRAVGRIVLAASSPARGEEGRVVGASDLLVGRRLDEAFTVGKELFLIFSVAAPLRRRDGEEVGEGGGRSPEGRSGWGGRGGSDVGNWGDREIAVRLHFGMSGCLYVASGGGTPRSVPEFH